MNEIKRYRTSDVRLQAGKPHVVLTESPSGQVCLYADVDPIVQSNKELEQRNAELEAEIKRLHEHVDSLACGISREAWHNKAWTLLQSRAIEDSEIMKVNIHTIRTIFNATYDALAGYTLANPNPAQEIPAELVAFINTFPELNMADYSDYDVARLNVWSVKLVYFVKSQLDKMKGKK
jgi:hypothetical protein